MAPDKGPRTQERQEPVVQSRFETSWKALMMAVSLNVLGNELRGSEARHNSS